MKIKRVLPNNRKKSFLIETEKKKLEFPFALLKNKPSVANPITSVFIDKEVGGQAFTYELKNGKTDTVLLEQVLFVNQDLDIIREHFLYDLTCKAREILSASQLTKRALARRLHIPPTQLYRLLNPTFYGKSIDQMVKLLNALGGKVDIVVRKAA